MKSKWTIWHEIKYRAEMIGLILLIIGIILIALSPFIFVGVIVFHPQWIGEWFGKIISGFNKVK